MKLSIEPGDYVVLIEINKEVLKCASLEEVDQADRLRYELVGRMSERLPAEVIIPAIIDYIRFGSGYIGNRIVWDDETESFFASSLRPLTAPRSERTWGDFVLTQAGWNFRAIIRT